MNEPTPIRPGMIVGILGGGQLGRMLAMAAEELGLSCHVYCPDPKTRQKIERELRTGGIKFENP